tara:strand:+ start:6478 stop:6777 length:300 start_codon:yes stop_codon:yes gene_type:complete
MGQVIRFPIDRIKPPTEVAYDLETVNIMGDLVEDLMEERGYDISKEMLNDIKVLTNLAYAACRRQGSIDQDHPFHDMMEEMSNCIDIAVKEFRGEKPKK